ncbi:hypothetical protein LPB140_07195 [Sphingorhabdus lutea]|uniref:ATPase n=1 Tax=Sphingorhabdus lutea TaxID=1913578 RepID=A0A1L3JBT9_9SPHN|nr:hypothetical protein [Sphingorhabdus lutea]APG62604.1 hypothetical protein LPB140_07195 [Sphingorhabdus lutea]
MAQKDTISQNDDDQILDLPNKKVTHHTENIKINSNSEPEIDPVIENVDLGDKYAEYEDEYIQPPKNYKKFILPFIFISLASIWACYFIWNKWSEMKAGMAQGHLPDLLSQYSAALFTPIILLIALWLLIMRNSRAESIIFGDVAAKLRVESEALDKKMSSINQNITASLNLLSEHSKAYISLADDVAAKMQQSGALLSSSFEQTDIHAKSLEQVSNSAKTNLDILQQNLPNITNITKDLTNQIGTTGRNAQAQLSQLKESFASLTTQAKTMEDASVALGNKNLEIMEQWQKSSKEQGEALFNQVKQSKDIIAQISNNISMMIADLHAKTRNVMDEMTEENIAANDLLNNNINTLTEKKAHLIEESLKGKDVLEQSIAEVEQSFAATVEKVNDLTQSSGVKMGELAFALAALDEKHDIISEKFSNNERQTLSLIAQCEHLLEALNSNSREMDESLPASYDRLKIKIAETKSALNNLNEEQAEGLNNAQKIIRLSETFIADTKAQAHSLDQLSDKNLNFIKEYENNIKLIDKEMRNVQKNLDHLSTKTDEEITTLLHNIGDKIGQLKSEITADFGKAIHEISNDNKQVIATATESQLATITQTAQHVFASHLELTEQSTQRLESKLLYIQEMTDNLEARLKQNEALFSGVDENDFTRRMALLTEALNSTSIDVAKILSNDVTDTSWAAYLKGDRGVFTRRAVRLLDNSEAKIIASYYEEDGEFHDNVNRYIHDFESMMRLVLSTKDGGAISVTLLSSDIGKLYVALAQAIERFRE